MRVRERTKMVWLPDRRPLLVDQVGPKQLLFLTALPADLIDDGVVFEVGAIEERVLELDAQVALA